MSSFCLALWVDLGYKAKVHPEAGGRLTPPYSTIAKQDILLLHFASDEKNSERGPNKSQHCLQVYNGCYKIQVVYIGVQQDVTKNIVHNL
jgi:hypothetical protein